MVRPAVAIRRISMPGHDNVNGHRSCSLHQIFEIIHLKPHQYAISIWQVVRVANGTMVVVYFEAVQLQNQLST
jgi:hypothetical protein